MVKMPLITEAERKDDRWRIYLAGVVHTLGLLIIVGWAVSHWSETALSIFGPTGWVPVPH